MKKFSTKNGAFTLIEMLIVVAIIGILVGIGVPALRQSKADARQAKVEAALTQVGTAKIRFQLDNDAVVSGSPVSPANIADYITINGENPDSTDAVSFSRSMLGTVQGNITIGAIDTAPSYTP